MNTNDKWTIFFVVLALGIGIIVGVAVDWPSYKPCPEAVTMVIYRSIDDSCGVFKQGDYVETVEGHRGYVQWTGTEPGLYGVKLTEYPLMFMGCFKETAIIRGEYLKLVEEP